MNQVSTTDENHISEYLTLYTQLCPILHRDETRQLQLEDAYLGDLYDLSQTSKVLAYLSKYVDLGHLSHLKRVFNHKTTSHRSGSIHENKKQQPYENDQISRPPSMTINKELSLSILIASSRDYEHLDQDIKDTLISHFGLEIRMVSVPKYSPLNRRQYEPWNMIWPLTFHAHCPSTPSPDRVFSPTQIIEMKKIMQNAIEMVITKRRYEYPNHPDMAACIIVNERGKTIAQSCCSPNSRKRLKHCAILAIGQVAAKQANWSDNPSADYLCTGCTAYFTREPCIMCSMALLHARIARVIYSLPNRTTGGLGSKYAIHCEKKLNHHFQVWGNFLSERYTQELLHFEGNRNDVTMIHDISRR